MKTRKSRAVLAVCVILVALGAGTVALAAANPPTTLPAPAAPVEQWRNRVADRAQAVWRRIAAGIELHPELAPKWEAILSLRQANADLAEANAALRAQLTTELKALRDSGTELPEEVRAQLREHRQELGHWHQSLRATAGDLRAIIAQALQRQVLRTLNYPQLDALLDDISAVLSARNDALQGINEIYGACLALLLP